MVMTKKQEQTLNSLVRFSQAERRRMAADRMAAVDANISIFDEQDLLDQGPSLEEVAMILGDAHASCEARISVNVGGKLLWQRFHENGQSGGVTIRNRAKLETVVTLLCEALSQAQGELSLRLDHRDRIPDGRRITISKVQGDVPISGMGRGEQHGELPEKSPTAGAVVSTLETVELTVCCEHDVALGVALDADDVPGVKILSGVDELHDHVLLLRFRSRPTLTPPAATAQSESAETPR
jgi:hypothetical protein